MSCGCRGPLRRVRHAIWGTLTTHTLEGHRVPNVSFFAAKYGSAAVASAWYPNSYKAADVIGQGTTAIGTAMGSQPVTEFAPELLHAVQSAIAPGRHGAGGDGLQSPDASAQ